MTAQQAGEGELFVIRRDPSGKQPKVVHFEGEPRRLMLHQLLQTPLFGLETLDSSYVEGLRDDLRMPRAKKGRSDRQEKKLEEIRETLSELPDWNSEPERETRQRQLMEEIARRLGVKDEGTES